MKMLAILSAAFALSGCAIASVASTAVDVATAPVKVTSRAIDLATTSQSETDEKHGRQLREADERRGRELRAMAERCRKGRPLATDDCAAVERRN